MTLPGTAGLTADIPTNTYDWDKLKLPDDIQGAARGLFLTDIFFFLIKGKNRLWFVEHSADN